MAELSAFRDGIMDRIRMREQRFDERAYLFVLSALEFCQQRLPERRHITGRELSLACRDLALDRFGVMSRSSAGGSRHVAWTATRPGRPKFPFATEPLIVYSLRHADGGAQ